MSQRTPNPNRTNFIVDIVIAAAFLAILSPALTGLPIHEWASLGFAAAIIVHLLLHWQWLVATTRRFVGHLTPTVRINYVLNGALFIAMTVAIFSGLMISEVIVKSLGLGALGGGAWRGIHGTSATISLLLVGGHLAMHWRWVMQTARQLLGRSARPAAALAHAEPVPSTAQPTARSAEQR